MIEILYFNKNSNSVNISDISQVSELLSDENNLLWIDIENPPNDFPHTAEQNLLQNILKIHPLTVEDCVVDRHQAKLEELPDYLFLIIYGLKVDNNKKIKSSKLSMILGKNFVVTYRHEKLPEIETVKNNFKSGLNHIRKSSVSLFYSVADYIVDGYLGAVDNMDIIIDQYEQLIYKLPNNTRILRRFNEVKNNVLSVRRLIVIEREIFYNISRGYYSIINEEERVFFRDIYDHLEKNLEMIDSQRESISSVMDMQMNLMSQKLNEIIKFLTIVSTIFLPANFIAGLFGMNFERMPLLNNYYGFTFAICSMFTIALLMILYFRKNKWI